MVTMRLICPNCDAQYEIGDDAIPEAGRDVQCSNCGHGWYQYHHDSISAGDIGDDIEDEETFASGGAADTGTAPTPDTPPPGVGPPADPPGGADALIAAMLRDGAPPTQTPGPPAAPEPEPAPVRRPLDESLLSVLREEAEREAEARRTEAPPRPLETQPDLGLAEQRPVRRIMPAPPAPAADTPDAADTAEDYGTEAGPRGTRRDLLPDIEEINSTLRPSTERRGPGTRDTLPEPPEARRRGFRIGFVGMMAIALILLGLYTAAPRISTSVPALETPLRLYVATVDKGRIGLDALMQRALGAMQGDEAD